MLDFGRTRLSILTTAVLALGVLSVSDSAAAAGAGNSVAEFHIAASQLADALSQFGAQSGLQIVYSPDLVQGLQCKALSGRLTAEAALEQMLAGTGITWTYLNSTTIVLNRARATRDTESKAPDEPSRVNRGPNDPAELEQILVTAQKKSERLQDVPIPVTVLSAEQLADSSQVLLRDYYTAVPELSVSPNYGGQQMLSIRGITTGGFTNPTVGVLIDDVPFGTSTFWAGNQVPDIDPGELSHVEVLRGPQGTLYGSNSMGGLIKFVTTDPSTDGYSGRLEAGSNYVHNGAEPGFNLRASANVPVSDTLAIRASGFTRQDPGYIDNPILNEHGVNEVQATGARLSAGWRPSENLSLKLSALYQRTKARGSYDVDQQSELGDLQQNYIHDIGGYDRTLQAYSAILKARLGRIDLTAVTGYGINSYSTSLDFTSVFGPSVEKIFGVPGSAYIDHDNITKFSQELRIAAPIGDHLELLTGAFYTHENAPDKELFTASVPSTGQVVGQYWYVTFPTQYEEHALFADLTYRITDRFDVQFGGRESWIRTAQLTNISEGPFVGPTPVSTPGIAANANAFTYLITPRYRLSPDLMLYARFASGYRPGGPQAAAVVAQGAPSAYDPDKTRNYELGIKADFFDHALTFDGSLYYIDWKNLQIQLKTADGIAYNANGSAAKSEGLELSTSARPLTGLTVSAWIAYDDAVLTENFPTTSTAYGVSGDRLPNTPRFSGNLSVRQDFPLWNGAMGFVGAAASYVGDRVSVFINTSQRQTFPSYTRTDLRAGMDYDSWTVSLYANNIADVRGVLNGGIGFTPPFAFTYIQPRTVGVSLVRAFR